MLQVAPLGFASRWKAGGESADGISTGAAGSTGMRGASKERRGSRPGDRLPHPASRMSNADQWLALPAASSRDARTASRLKEAGFWRGGNFLKLSIWPAT